ncbi:MAG: type IV secretory system conjugative DNA transfer family protein [Candidatus Dormibacteraeota bacterium]|nr:type IV secretory system conjugative DNA transfer family protein [Candidatus Dormibacteraeota bacterium]
MALLVVLILATGVLHVVAGVDTWIAHQRWAPPDANSVSSGWAIISHAGQVQGAWPAATRNLAPATAWFWVSIAVAAALLATIAAAVLHIVLRLRAGSAAVRKGFATRAQLARSLGRRAALERAAVLRPSLSKPAVTDVAIHLGRAADHGVEVYARIEDSIAALGPPGSGKTSQLFVPGVIHHPGPAIVTSTKPELLFLTAALRRGPVWVFDPAGCVAAGVLARMGWHTVAWDPIRECDIPRVAMRRARVAVGASAAGRGVTSADYWRASAESLCQGYFHAAALDGANVRTVMGWVDNPTDKRAADILLDDQRAAPGWGDRLLAQLDGALDDRARQSVLDTLRRAFDAVADPEVMATCCPAPGAEVFDPAAFVRDGGTLYLVGDPEDQVQVAPLLTLLLDAVVGAARQRAAQSPGGRLDPPLGVWLDEATQIAPLPSLPSLVSDARGVGITVAVALQTLSRAREVWGTDGAATLWENCTAKVIFGGISDHRELDALSQLAGEYDETVHGSTRDQDGRISRNESTQRRRRLAADEIRQLGLHRRHIALLVYRDLPPVLLRLTPYFSGPDARRIAASQPRALA